MAHCRQLPNQVKGNASSPTDLEAQRTGSLPGVVVFPLAPAVGGGRHAAHVRFADLARSGKELEVVEGGGLVDSGQPLMLRVSTRNMPT